MYYVLLAYLFTFAVDQVQAIDYTFQLAYVSFYAWVVCDRNAVCTKGYVFMFIRCISHSFMLCGNPPSHCFMYSVAWLAMAAVLPSPVML